jgi:hypothetical protein
MQEQHQTRVANARQQHLKIPGPLARRAVDFGPYPGRRARISAGSKTPKACIFSRALPPFSHGAGIAYTQRKGDFRTGEAVMAKVLNDILLFSCIAAFVTGIVLAAASLLT